MAWFTVAEPQANLSIDAFDTSAPEVAVSIGAELDGKPDIAMGNVMGSNIFDLLFTLAHLGHPRHQPTALGHGGLSVLTGRRGVGLRQSRRAGRWAHLKTRLASPQPP